jgi:tryptophan synthase alpha chain
MTRTEELFKNKKKIMTAFLVLGDPSPTEFVDLALSAIDAGVDSLEIGLAFSDPTADGPTVQKAHYRALSRQMTFSQELNCLKTLRKKTDVPLGLLTYVQRSFCVGHKTFLKKMVDAGVDNVLFADAPFDVDPALTKLILESPLDNIGLLAANTGAARLKEIEKHSSGYLYGVSLLGVTGARDKLLPQQKTCLKKWKKQAKLPVMVGFGLSSPEHLKQVYACGIQAAVIGSAGVKHLEHPNKKTRLKNFTNFYKHCAKGKR